MKIKNKKKKITWQQYIVVVFSVLLGLVFSILTDNYFESFTTTNLLFDEFLIKLGLLSIGMCIAFFVQIIIHEAGHLIFGLLTGYRYISFRIGSFMWVKENDRIHFKRLSLAGTGGQCLMSPPDMIDGKIPYILYNLGGSFMNIIFGLVFLGLYQFLKDIPYLSVTLLIASIVGFASALLNGIPMRLGIIDNDGYNALSLGKSPEALRSFWIQIKVNEQMTKGVRLKDMPEEWFIVPSEDGMKNSMTAARGVFTANRMIDEHAFGEAQELMEKLLKMDSAIVGLHRNLMQCDIVFCELIDKNREEYLDAILDKQQKKFIKQMKNFPSVIRTEFAYALLAEDDDLKAGKIKKRFEKCALSYPYQSDIESERELIQIAEEWIIVKVKLAP
ncbi:M50 family metallopeptidase [Anaerocolumna sp.]|uniref:M50 family metallopeptidase n=1 Tax=Anaerocolumna sp. TaxID=2041569 RepID=UPI0028A7CA19|nr:M50 family metallopeptidase [Anaerocolumna sp.]